MTQNLGKAYSIIAKQEAQEQAMYADLGAFYAPSECYRDVRKGEKHRERIARRHAKAVSGLSRRQFNVALKGIPWRARQRAYNELMYKMFH